MFLMFIHLVCSFQFFSYADSVNVPIENHLQDRSIVAINYTIPGSFFLHTANMENNLLPGSSNTVRMPFGYINKLIFEADDGAVYSQSDYPASVNADTIRISLARKEFGGLFERVYGIYPLAIQNSTDVKIFSVLLQGDSLPTVNILRNNILLPGEILRVWLDSGKTVQISTLDYEGNISSLVTATAPATDSLFRITPDLFFSNGEEFGYDESLAGSWMVNCVTLSRIAEVEVFSPEGYFLDGLDCSSSPLGTWDRVFLRHDTPVGYIVCTDESNRTYSADAADSLTGSFIIGDLNLDFGFGFPE